MLTRKTFVHAIENIKKHEVLMAQIHKPLNEISDFPLDLDFSHFHREALLDVLRESMNDRGDVISWWLYENVEKIITWTENGKEIKYDVTAVDDLYDYLVTEVKRIPFEMLPLEDCFEETEDPLRQHKSIRKRDFLIYFDRIMEYVEKTHVILHIHADEGNPPKAEALMLSMKRYTELTAMRDDESGERTETASLIGGDSKNEVSDVPD